MNQQLREQLALFQRRFEATEDDFEDFDDEMTSVADMSQAEFEEFLARRAATEYGRLFAQFRDFALTSLIPEYVSSSVVDRAHVREAVAEHLDVRSELWSLMGEYRWRLQKAQAGEHEEVLRTLLKLAVIDERHLDEVATAHILTSVWGDAKAAGLDPAKYFAEAAELAGTSKLQHGKSARDVLLEFEPYIYGA